MSMNNADKPAQPIFYESGNSEIFEYGLTKRERFAMAAMQGYLSDDETKARINSIRREGDSLNDAVASLAVDAADALLKELEGTQ